MPSPRSATDTPMTDRPNWEGLPGSTEHRTVGPVRAWCYQDAEWCYPDYEGEGDHSMLCPCCDQLTVPTQWKGYHPGYILDALYEKVLALQTPELDGHILLGMVFTQDVLDLIGEHGD